MRQLFSIVFLCTCGVGCAALNLQRPTATVTNMAVRDVDSKGFTMNFGVDVANPNTIALPLSAADYKVGLGGVKVVDGNTKPEGSIPAGGTRSVTVPVSISYESLLAAEQSIVKSGGNVPYALDGGLSFNPSTPMLGDLRVPLQYNGVLPLKDVFQNPQAIMQSPAAQKLARELIGGWFSR